MELALLAIWCFLVGVAGAFGHLPNAAPDVAPIVVGGAASIPGALLGSRLTVCPSSS